MTRNNPNFTLYAEAPVRRVLVEDGRAVGVVVGPDDGSEHEVRARYVVVAADALRTPQVLFASGVRPPALGRYLNDQPQTVFAVRLRDVGTPPWRSTSRAAKGSSGRAACGWVPYTDEHPFHGQVMQLDASPIPLVSDDEPAPGTHRRASAGSAARTCGRADRIEFVRVEVDDYGMPKPSIHYVLTDRDHASLAAAREQILRAARALGEFIGDEPLVLAPGASLHYQGTTRMGPADDGTSVCGPNGEVWQSPASTSPATTSSRRRSPATRR